YVKGEKKVFVDLINDCECPHRLSSNKLLKNVPTLGWRGICFNPEGCVFYTTALWRQALFPRAFSTAEETLRSDFYARVSCH
ncbi:MAG: hypothetical protein LPH19_14545, partial [Shewanella sp.]|nr:hypothetical protein [Shewanella sp.]MCF1430534.1 hypothetical protein [Shewanella sp.]